jgi:hypothetical protein
VTSVTGWITVALIVFAALFPIVYRIVRHKRAALTAAPTRWHVVAGTAVVVFAFVHSVGIVTDLGSPAAIVGGMVALLAGGVAFFLLMIHAGLGLQLRNPKLRDRIKKRSMHTTTATAIVVTVAVHVVLLMRAAV